MNFCDAKNCDELANGIGIEHTLPKGFVNKDGTNYSTIIWLCVYHYNAFLDKQTIRIKQK